MAASPPSVVLVGGWSWHRHVGDDAILRAHLVELSRHLPDHEAVVVCGEPERLMARMRVRAVWSAAPSIVTQLDAHLSHDEVTSAHLVTAVEAVVRAALAGRAGELPELRGLVDVIAHADAVIAASAGSLTGAYPLTIAEQVVVLAVAQALGKPTVVSGASLGPFDAPADGELLGSSLVASDLVALRDGTVSPGRARGLGVYEDRMRVHWDPACWMPDGTDGQVDDVIRQAGLGRDTAFGLLTVAPWPGGSDQIEPLAAAIDAVMGATGLPFLGIPMYLPPDRADERAIDAVRDCLSRPDLLVRLSPLPEDPVLLTLSGRASIVIGSRFHGAVFAAARGTPTVLVHDGAYQRDKAESLAAATTAVRAIPLDAGADAIAAAALDRIGMPAPMLSPTGPLPAVAWLARHLDQPQERGIRRLLRRR